MTSIEDALREYRKAEEPADIRAALNALRAAGAPVCPHCGWVCVDGGLLCAECEEPYPLRRFRRAAR